MCRLELCLQAQMMTGHHLHLLPLHQQQGLPRRLAELSIRLAGRAALLLYLREVAWHLDVSIRRYATIGWDLEP